MTVPNSTAGVDVLGDTFMTSSSATVDAAIGLIYLHLLKIAKTKYDVQSSSQCGVFPGTTEGGSFGLADSPET